jgi:Phosphate transport (Pho88)
MMQVSKRVPFDDPDVLLGVRALYIVSNVIILSIYLYVQAKINKKKGMFLSLMFLIYIISICICV